MSTSLIITLLILLSLATWLAFKRSTTALYVVIFLAPWEGLDIDVGLRLTAYQIFLAPLVLVMLLRLALRNSATHSPFVPNTLILFALFAALSSFLRIPFLPVPLVEVSGGALRGPEARAMIQIAMFVFVISPVLIAPFVLRRPEQLMVAAKTYLLSLVVLAAIGWFQLLVWYGTENNPIPIGFVDVLLGGTAREREGYYGFIDLLIYRMNSFGGEPKNLGSAFVIGMLIIQALLTTAKRPLSGKLMYLWGFLAFSTLATLSTTAFFLWAIGTVMLVVAPYLFHLRHEQIKATGFRRLGILLLLIVLIVAGAEVADVPLGEILVDRTVTRVAESQFGVFEDFDDAILDYLFDHPSSAITGVGLGNAHLYADPYLAPEIADFTGGGVFVAKAQYLRLISEVGIIGLGLFLVWYLKLISSTSVRLRTTAAMANFAPLVTFGFANLFVFMAAGASAAQFYITAGVISAAYVMCNNSNK